ncbi:MAG: alpha/beta hydrolase [Niastella sp.]|nr:alpha/beta hydrolase [Niastella sp.]
MKQLLILFTTLPLVLLLNCRQPVVQIIQSSGSIQAGNFLVYYQRTGYGQPLVLLHAGLQDHAMWDEQVKALSTAYEVITPDLPYHGRTTGADTNLLACDVIRVLLDSLRIQQVSIGGSSIGCMVAQDFVIAYPDRVDKAIFVSPSINAKDLPADSLSKARYSLFMQAYEKKDTVKAARAFTKIWATGLRDEQPDSVRARVELQVFNTTLANLRHYKMGTGPRLQTSPPAFERLSSITKPVLIIDGDKDLPFISYCAGILEKQVPGAVRKTIPGTAHMLNMEKPALFNDLLLSFLKRTQ